MNSRRPMVAPGWISIPSGAWTTAKDSVPANDAPPPEPMIQPMRPHRVQSRVVQKYGKLAGRRGITLQYGLNVFSNRSQHVHASLALFPYLRCNFYVTTRCILLSTLHFGGG